MQLAYYMGFKDVYLIGFDHSYRIPDDAVVEGRCAGKESRVVQHDRSRTCTSELDTKAARVLRGTPVDLVQEIDLYQPQDRGLRDHVGRAARGAPGVQIGKRSFCQR